MKNRKIIITVLTLSIALFITAFVFAEYYYQRTIQDQEVGLGSISIKDSRYLSYAGKDDDGYTTTRLAEPEKISTSERIFLNFVLYNVKLLFLVKFSIKLLPIFLISISLLIAFFFITSLI